MKDEEIIELVRKIGEIQCETNVIELKSSSKGVTEKLYDTISSFSNQDTGGVIVFGINEEDYKPCGVLDAELVQKKVGEQCEEMVPVVRPVLSCASIDGKKIVTAEVPSADYSDRPVYWKKAGLTKGSWIRVGDMDKRMSDYEIYKYQAYKKGIHDDQRIIENGWALLDEELLSRYLDWVTIGKKNLFEHVSRDKMQELFRITQHEKPTLGAFLVFSQFPQAVFNNLCVTAVAIPGKERGDKLSDGTRFLDNKRINGSIPSMLSETMDFILKNTANRTVIDSSGIRKDMEQYPPEAVREALLNALIHRDYSVFSENSPIRVEIFTDRLEITSPGGLYGRARIETLGYESQETRNSILTSILETLKLSENRYSGIPTMRNVLKNAGLPDPEFIDTGTTFKVIFRNIPDRPVDNLVTETEKQILEYCRVPRTRKEIANYLGKTYNYVNSYILKKMIEKGLLNLIVDGNNKRKQKLQSAVATE